jgi:hypothetical protein
MRDFARGAEMQSHEATEADLPAILLGHRFDRRLDLVSVQKIL